jgi:hypothetical protein
MRTFVRIPAILMLITLGSGLAAVGATATAQDFWPWATPPPKPAREGEAAPRVPVTQGDTVDDPFAIEGIPFYATGSTCAFNNDYDYACPYTGSTSADVVYKLVPTENAALRVDLCASTYDTKIYICMNTADNVIACNDDYCSYQSVISYVPVTTGNTYYIVIDGYGGSCGNYSMTVEEFGPCVLECPPGSMLEGEPECYDGYEDQYNPGCGGETAIFQQIPFSWESITICGTTGVFYRGTELFRDTDWYEIEVTDNLYFWLNGDAEIPMTYMIIDGRGGCSNMTVVTQAPVGPCSPVSDIAWHFDPGTWWIWVGPSAWDPEHECGSIYILTIEGYTDPPSGGTTTTWGQVKSLFR